MFTKICGLVITLEAASTSSAFIIDSHFYTAPTSHRLWRAPEADFPPSSFGLRRPPTIAQKTNSATRHGRTPPHNADLPAVISEGGATPNSQQSTLNFPFL